MKVHLPEEVCNPGEDVDYLTQPLGFKIKKVMRYCRLYGPLRTLVKVRAQRHKQRRFQQLPPVHDPADGQSVGLIGCGNYGFSHIAYYLTKAHGAVIGGCMDTDIHRAASLSHAFKVPFYTSAVEDVIENDRIQLLYIASNHASHAEYAICGLEHGKDVYIEKPHVVDEDQLDRLVLAMRRSQGRVYLGFNRPGSRLGKIVHKVIGAQSGPGMYNWFVSGHEIDRDHWYFHPREGGRILGNLCHWTDFLFTLAAEPRFPIRINPTSDRKSDVDIAVTYTFGDGSIGVITFSAKGHTFEGVKEHFCAHRGNALVNLEDFQRLTVDVVDKKRRYHNLFRDHGHQANIVAAYENSTQRLPYDRQQRCDHLANTAVLFLKTKQALEENRQIVVEPFDVDSVGLPDKLSA